MKYRVTIEGREREVDVTLVPGGSVRVTLDGAPVDAEIRPLPGAVSVRIGGRVHDVLVASAGRTGGEEEMHLAAGSARAIAQVLSEKARAAKTKAGASGARELRAPMPGRVVRVLCKVGDAVTQGQPLVVVEAMKMENELRASAAATIAQVHVSEGASVEGRALLVTFAE